MIYDYDGYLYATPYGIYGSIFRREERSLSLTTNYRILVSNDNALKSDMQTWFFTGFKHVCNNNIKASKLVLQNKESFRIKHYRSINIENIYEAIRKTTKRPIRDIQK